MKAFDDYAKEIFDSISGEEAVLNDKKYALKSRPRKNR